MVADRVRALAQKLDEYADKYADVKTTVVAEKFQTARSAVAGLMSAILVRSQ
ncbi:MAG: hypothetical protein LBO08_01220 [Rickettsiales bacterium]|jgi:hypothetical protein|nr:hypothetical protein [Rickettsiales bacterium]